METGIMHIPDRGDNREVARLPSFNDRKRGSSENHEIDVRTLRNISSSKSAIAAYEKLMEPARERFASSVGIRGMIDPETDAKTMAAFLLHFSALSVSITEPVEGWILQAAEKCSALGLDKIAQSLFKHAKAEAGHDQYHLNDFNNLISFWNARWAPAAIPTDILVLQSSRGGERYIRLHEENIAGSTPYCQFAIEYEIELLPVQFGADFVRNCVRLLGEKIMSCLSFVTSHVEFDVGHTKFNSHFLGNLILEDPSRLAPLAAAGTAALDSFADHLSECLELARQFARES